MLIDDADKPFRDKLFSENIKKVHDFLLGLYITTKGCDEHIEFSLMTGLHPIKGDMLFGFNNFTDLSLHKDYGDVCGYSQKDVETTFAPYLEV